MNEVKLIAAAFLSILLITTGSRVLVAQSGAGSIQGTVTDSTGAVLPAASIHVVNVATGVPTNTTSNTTGFFQVPELFTGNYSVTVTAPGMKTYKTSIELQVAQNANINPVLTAGAVTEQVVVNADTIQLTTQDSGAIGSTLENQRINQLPMDGRNILTLVGETTPGLESGGQVMNGQPDPALVFLVDGTSTANNLFGGQVSSNVENTNSSLGAASAPPVQIVDPDAIQEVKVQATGSGAQYAAPATVVMTTKPGTNTIHGTAFETARNNAFGVSRSRQDAANYSAPHLVRNEFGASAGGPIVLPHVYHGKDRSFWFFAYERYSLAQSNSVLSSVPTMDMRQGNYSGAFSSAGVLQTLYDPSTTTNPATANPACPVPNATKAPFTTPNNYCRTPFSNNTIPQSKESPLYKVYAALLPQPTNSANPLVQTNLTSLSPILEIVPQMTFRLDHVFNEKNRAFLRYSQILGNTNIFASGVENLPYNANGINIPAGAATQYSNDPESSFLASADYTHIFSSTFFAETIVAQQWLNDLENPGADPNVNYEKMLNLPNNFGELGFPDITGQMVQLIGSQASHVTISQISSTIDENLTKIAGRHQLYFGGRFMHQRDADLPTHGADVISFTAPPAALYNPTTGANYGAYPNTGYGDASLFLGSAASYGVYLSPPLVHYHVIEFDAYLQDDFHVSKNLTVNLGLRYEAHPSIWTKDDIGDTFDLKNDAMVLQVPTSTLIAEGYTTQAIITNDANIGMKFETPAEAGMPFELKRNYNLIFLPRFGFAYLPFNNKWGTVIRGAFGRYDYPNSLAAYENHWLSSDPFTSNWSQSYATAAQAIDNLPNEQLRYNAPVQFGVAGMNTANVVNTSTINSILPGVVPYGVSPATPPLYTSETNFTIEQPFKGHSVLRASYIWNHGTNLNIAFKPNLHPTTYEWEMATGTIPPTGGASVIGTPQQNTYSVTATGPYDRTTYGNLAWNNRSGWSNYNALQLNYQRLFNHGYAYQISYVYAKSMTASGTLDPAADYPGVEGTLATMTPAYGPVYPGVPPPPVPKGVPVWAQYHALTDYEFYQQDNTLPTMHIRFNWLVDLPVGRGKKFLGNSNRFVNELIGGFQLAGDGSISSDLIQPNTFAIWGQTSPLTIYKHKAPITDCRSGVCDKSYLWFNGYIAPTTYINCTTNCVTGLPSSYQPVETWVDNTPGDTYYGTNNVQVSSPALLASNKGVPITEPYDGGPAATTAGGPASDRYLGKSWIHGPINWPIDASLFKVFPITERFNLRLNLDAFNVFNMPGQTDPGADGVQNYLQSANPPRELQITARLTF